MGRPIGARSEGYERKRTALADAVLAALLADPNLSLRTMAEAAGVSRPTLLHYFGSRDGAIQAAMERAGVAGEAHLVYLREMRLIDPEDALCHTLEQLCVGWHNGVGSLHYTGLRTGLRDRELAHTYRSVLLDPSIDAIAGLLSRLTAAGLLGPCEPRTGAMQVLSPCLVALIHQHGLDGASDRPMQLDGLIRATVRDFVAAWPPA